MHLLLSVVKCYDDDANAITISAAALIIAHRSDALIITI